MKPLVRANYIGPDGPWFCFELQYGVLAKVAILEEDVARVVLVRRRGSLVSDSVSDDNDNAKATRIAYRLDRTWSVAPSHQRQQQQQQQQQQWQQSLDLNSDSNDYAGRHRDSLDGFSLPPTQVTVNHANNNDEPALNNILHDDDGDDDTTKTSTSSKSSSEVAVVVILEGGNLIATITTRPFGICWNRRSEPIPFLQDRPTQAYFMSNQSFKLAHYVVRHAHECHYGLGDKSGPLDKTGRRFKIDAVDSCGYDAETSDPLYKMIPFYIVHSPTTPTGAHGIFYDNMATAQVDLGATVDNYHGCLFRSYQADDGDLDYYVLAGPTVPDVVRRFSWMTGGQAFPPRWSLGFAVTGMTLMDAPDANAKITEFLHKCRQHQIPCRSFHFGSGYCMHNDQRYTFCWNRDKFPQPAETIQQMESTFGIRAVANLKPCLLEGHPRLSELLIQQPHQQASCHTDHKSTLTATSTITTSTAFTSSCPLVMDQSSPSQQPAVAQFWDGLGYHLDFTHPAGRRWWQQRMEDSLLAHGVSAIWNDNNEYEIWDEDATCHGDGRCLAQSLIRPAQALLMTQLAYETQARFRPHERPYTITRAGAAGFWRYGQSWSGDNTTAWKTLRFNLAQGLTMVLSGIFNTGHDVGGFHGPCPGPELLVRFTQFCCLWPRFVMNSWNTSTTTTASSTSGGDGAIPPATVPWLYPDMLPHICAALHLRERLLPLLYTLMHRAALDNEPAIRPLLWEFPHDARAVGIDDAFMLGRNLLVAPVLEEGATSRRVYLPRLLSIPKEEDGSVDDNNNNNNNWYDFYSPDQSFRGGQEHLVPAPLNRLPLFVREGVVIPVAHCDDDNNYSSEMVDLIAFGAVNEKQKKVYVYQDNGVDMNWRSIEPKIISFNSRAPAALQRDSQTNKA